MVLDIIKIEYFFIILEFHTVEYLVFPFSFLISRRSSLLYLLSNSPSIYSQSSAEISIVTRTDMKLVKSKKMASIYGQSLIQFDQKKRSMNLVCMSGVVPGHLL